MFSFHALSWVACLFPLSHSLCHSLSISPNPRSVTAKSKDVLETINLDGLKSVVNLLNKHVSAGEMHHGLDADHVLHTVGDVDSEIGGGTPGSPSDVAECRVVSHHTLHPLERPLLLHSLISLIFFFCMWVFKYFILWFLWFSLPKYTPASIKKKKNVCPDSSLESVKHIFQK